MPKVLMTDDPYQKYWDEWYAYEKKMKRPDVLKDHNFVDFKCIDCETTSRDVASGTKSWVCFGTSMSCCGMVGISKWDQFTQQWKCSRCNSIISNDPNFSNSSIPSWSWSSSKKEEPSVPRYIDTKCTCGAHAVSSNNHSPWCDWRPNK